MKSVCVLLSTYNGEKFLSEQLESLSRQEKVNLSVFIRDDGSSDNTINIIKDYIKKDSRFSYYIGENVGPSKSFIDLIKKSDKYDFYAFCDQDDVWDADKLSVAIEKLNIHDSSKPNLYFSNLRIVDKDLIFIRNSNTKPLTNKRKYSALIEGMGVGCTMVFNYKTKILIENYCHNNYYMHDGFLYLLCNILGNIIYDFEPHISYRQHDNNVVGTYKNTDFYNKYIVRFLYYFNNIRYTKTSDGYKFLLDFKSLLSEKDIAKIYKILNYKKSLRNKIKLLLDKDLVCSNLKRELFYIFTVLTNTL